VRPAKAEAVILGCIAQVVEQLTLNLLPTVFTLDGDHGDR